MTAVGPRRVLVTGGAGFIGSHLVDALLESGCEVAAIDNFDPFYAESQKRANVAPHVGNPRFRLYEIDVADPASVRSVPGAFDAVVHLAAKAGVRPSIADPRGYHHVNVGGTQTMLEFARERGVPQFVFGSSSSVYGTNPRAPWSEDDPVLRPISPYASSKVGGELLGHVYAHLHGIRFVALRFFTAYGPRQRPDLAIHAFARRMLAGQAVPMYGDGSTSRDYTYVADIVEGIRSALTFDASSFEVINLGNHRTVPLRDVVTTLESTLGVQARVEVLPEQQGDVPHTWARIDKAQALLGYAPQVGFEDGVARFTEWLRGARHPAEA